MKAIADWFLGAVIFLAMLVSAPATKSAIAKLGLLESSLVKISEKDLEGASVSKYPGITKIRCAAITQATKNETPTYCMAENNDCLVTTAAFPSEYDSTGGLPPLYTCYTTAKPLIDIAAALAACGGNPSGCCPPPFQDVPMLGCVFTSVWFFPNQPYEMARKFCQSMWAGCDLFIKPTNLAALKQYVNSQAVFTPVFLGARADPAGSKSYKWIDGTDVSYMDLPLPIRDKFASLPPPAPAIQVDCVAYDSQGRGIMDDSCLYTYNYLCQIK